MEGKLAFVKEAGNETKVAIAPWGMESHRSLHFPQYLCEGNNGITPNQLPAMGRRVKSIRIDNPDTL
jgi:hypothetical protein